MTQAPSGGEGLADAPAPTHVRPAPELTFANVMRHADVFGITRVGVLTGLDRLGVPVVVVCRPNARSSAVFHGKGLTLAAAKASGVMEAAETWAAEHCDLPLRFASYDELRRTARVVDIARLPLTPGAVVDPARPMLWAEGRTLGDGAPIYAPIEMVSADSTLDGPPVSGAFNASTNGLASGAHLSGAINHALCELIERDATALWRQLPPDAQDARRLDLASVDDPVCRDLLARFEAADIDLLAYDATSDLNVPVYQCFARDRTGEIAHVGVGAGCHPNRGAALARALTEAAQVRMTYIVGSREDIRHADYDHAHIGAFNAAMREAQRRAGPRRDFRAAPSFAFDDFAHEEAFLRERLAEAGIEEIAAFDLSRPDYGLCVVKLVAPGLEGFDHNPAGYAPGPRARRAA